MLKFYLGSYNDFLQLEKGLALTSIEAYLNDLIKLDEFLVTEYNNYQIGQIERAHLLKFLEFLNELGFAPSSQARMVSSIKSFFSFITMEKIILNNPAELLEAPKLSRKLPEVLSFDEIEAICSAVDLSTNEGHRNRAIFELLYACGLRVSELVNLKISNLYLEIGFIKVLGKGNKERLVPIGESAVKYLNFYLDERKKNELCDKEFEDIVFLNRRGKQLTRNMIFFIVKETAKNAGIEKSISPHTFRHSFATHLIEGGANLRVVQQLLGHESITTTEIYIHLDINFLKETIRSYHPRARR